MSEFMKIVLSLSISGALLMLVVLGLKQIYKNKFSKRWSVLYLDNCCAAVFDSFYTWHNKYQKSV